MPIPAPDGLSDDLLSILGVDVDRRWNAAEPHGTPVVVTFGFPQELPGYDPDIPGFQPFTEDYFDIIRGALATWDDASGLTFVEVPGDLAEITFSMRDMEGLTNATGNPLSGFGYYPGVSSYTSNGETTYYNRLGGQSGDIWMNADYYGGNPATMAPGVRGYSILLHEIGHAVGLQHPFAGPVVIDPAFDNGLFTIMSYDRSHGTVALGTLDVEAMQVLYGPDVAQAAHWDADLGALVQDAPQGGGALFAHSGPDRMTGFSGDDRFHGAGAGDTIAGAGGTDLVSVNETSFGVTLTPDANGPELYLELDDGTLTLSSVETLQFLNQTMSIDSLLGPSVTLTGTDDPEALTGGDGPDSLSGAGGDDTLRGGWGSDRIDGGAGNDVAQGEYGNDVLNGDAGNDSLSGGGGDDRIDGGEGDDLLAGGSEDDTLMGGAGDDLIGGGTGGDTIDGGEGNDIIGAGLGDDTAIGNAGNDIVNGGAGNDTLTGGDGDDTMGASFGDDYLLGGNGADDMGGGTGRDLMYGLADNDTLGAGEGDDTVDGGAGDDFVAGGGRNDVVNGQGGDDKLIGGTGDDTLSGGTGADLFIFNLLNAGETDIITDFETGTDRLRLTGAGGFGALDIESASGSLRITVQGHEIVLQGVAAADFGADDILFI
ncbi:matrixin family metalloprotease [Aestuariicoccus sp. MJ-SS9]|uniref:matrixin family metalloprotease n=1 Tax=Aestuariicoccus sp. MJ-SS9 TaxID=3079855 RepID=UPI0029091DDD|nr:matrixin family metalloprotease [Aestuariicoccus sp. MJ-SS9]MDU8911879.1 hypothetical protein [Aestuariicoccus sp. MJ-SS9]